MNEHSLEVAVVMITVSILICIGFNSFYEGKLEIQEAEQHKTYVDGLENLNKKLISENRRLNRLLKEAFQEPLTGKNVMRHEVTATAYSARKKECDLTPHLTASMSLSRVGVIAVSRDLEAIGLKMGKFVLIKGMGLFRVEDRMNSRWKNRIDILHANAKAAEKFSPRKVMLIWLGGSRNAG